MKRFVKVFLCVVAVLALTACGGQNGIGNGEIELNRLKNESGEFQFYDMEWNCNLEKAEEFIGCKMESVGKAQGYETYLVQKVFKWNDVEGDFFCDFNNAMLESLSITFKPEEQKCEQFWEDLTKALMDQYGVVDPEIRTSENSSFSSESETYLWEANNQNRTILTISKSYMNGEFVNISLNVSVVPEKNVQ